MTSKQSFSTLICSLVGAPAEVMAYLQDQEAADHEQIPPAGHASGFNRDLVSRWAGEGAEEKKTEGETCGSLRDLGMGTSWY